MPGFGISSNEHDWCSACGLRTYFVMTYSVEGVSGSRGEHLCLLCHLWFMFVWIRAIGRKINAEKA